MFSIINRSIRRDSRSKLNENYLILIVASNSKLRHSTPLVYFSHIFHHIFTNTSQVSSVYTAHSEGAHTKNSNCWINRNFFKSLYSYRNYHKCNKTNNSCISANYSSRRFVSIENSKKMVWITDLDNPQVD